MAKKSKKIVLLVEDEQILLEALTERLKNDGFTVFGHTSAPEALQSIKTENPDLVMTDIIMEPTNGLEMLQMIKNDDSLSDIPSIVLTNSNELRHVEEAKALGVKEFLVKADHSLEEIAKKVSAVLGAH